MTKCSLALLCAVALPVPALLAQSPAPVPRRILSAAESPERTGDETLDGNYVLTLAFSKDQTAHELSIVLAVANFSISSIDPAVTFVGTCNRQGEGTLLVSYDITRQVAIPSGNNVNFGNVNARTSVLLHLGEPVRIIKDGEQTYTLKVDRYKAETH